MESTFSYAVFEVLGCDGGDCEDCCPMACKVVYFVTGRPNNVSNGVASSIVRAE
jgi:hypothetical protein